MSFLNKKENCNGCGKEDRAPKMVHKGEEAYCHDCSNKKFTPGRGTFVGDAETSFGGPSLGMGLGGLGMGSGGLRIPMGGFLGGPLGGGPSMTPGLALGFTTGDLKFKGCIQDPYTGDWECHAKKKKSKGKKGNKSE